MGSTIATGDRSVVADNSSVWLTEGSSLSTYRISGSGSVTAEGGSALNVTQNVTVDGSVTVADSTLTAKSAAVSNGNLSVSGASMQIYTISCTALHPVVHAAEFFTPAADSSIEFFF